MATQNAQVRKLMTEYQKHGKVEIAALRSGMHRNTAGKYLKEGKLPSEMTQPRTWRTRKDPFEEHWPEIVAKLRDAPGLEAKTLFEDLCERYPDRYQPGQLRTLQRRIKVWRVQEGPEKEVFFSQQHRPGEAMQTDFTWAGELGITLEGEPFDHLLCHSVLPYSNWEWVTVCLSESMSALRRGVQASVFELGHVTEWHQTDNSSAATHDLRTGKRGFNEEYEALMRHLGMKPRTIGVGKKEQNGDVESLNGWLKRRLEQHLLLRGSRDFPNGGGRCRGDFRVRAKINPVNRTQSCRYACSAPSGGRCRGDFRKSVVELVFSILDPHFAESEGPKRPRKGGFDVRNRLRDGGWRRKSNRLDAPLP